MKSLIAVTLVGRVGQDLELKKIENGEVVDINVATNEKIKDKEYTDWHRVTAWNGLATIADNLLQKGSLVLIQGSIRNDNYEKDGVNQYGYRIVADKIILLADGKEKVVNS
jgi:single-strand DNA-binding protein